MSDHNNRANVLAQAVNKMSCEIELIRIWVIGFELLEESSELFDILRYSRGVFDVEKWRLPRRGRLLRRGRLWAHILFDILRDSGGHTLGP
jgi:hypothetical protein